MLSNRAQRHGMVAPPVADASVQAGTLPRSFGMTAGSNPASARCREVAFNASGYSRAHFLWMFRVRMHADFQLDFRPRDGAPQPGSALTHSSDKEASSDSPLALLVPLFTASSENFIGEPRIASGSRDAESDRQQGRNGL